MAVRTAPRTMNALARAEVERRSDYARWCEGVRIICDQLAQIVTDMHDELYLALAHRHPTYAGRAKARMALRPLLSLAAAIHAAGRLAPRAFRVYARRYAEEIQPTRARKPRFDHTS